jgi:hypothetical protein
MIKIKGKFLKLLNIKQTQKHPFHVLRSSNIPIIIATLFGLIALSFIVKLHNINYYELNLLSIIAGLVILIKDCYGLGLVQKAIIIVIRFIFNIFIK